MCERTESVEPRSVCPHRRKQCRRISLEQPWKAVVTVEWGLFVTCAWMHVTASEFFISFLQFCIVVSRSRDVTMLLFASCFFLFHILLFVFSFCRFLSARNTVSQNLRLSSHPYAPACTSAKQIGASAGSSNMCVYVSFFEGVPAERECDYYFCC